METLETDVMCHFPNDSIRVLLQHLSFPFECISMLEEYCLAIKLVEEMAVELFVEILTALQDASLRLSSR